MTAQFFKQANIERTIATRCAEHHAGKTGGTRRVDIAFHHIRFVAREDEITGARPDHDAHRQPAGRRTLHETRRWRHTAAGKSRAKFDAIGPAADRRFQTGDIVHTNFENHRNLFHLGGRYLRRPFPSSA